ncbi:3'-5' exoribonuclease [Escherichia coli]|nr:3'-5' exonuclease [Escherichia coli]EFC6890758.1 3'-5' exoribonuclease [Escherichia coli]EFD0755783.1 3'-5' exoribonuclease [Escherichia coli]EFD0775240.1 3'-5' exoribonuclease [Escherichia coli]MBI0803213.1 3'-5' exoribonuclease [Escherichia coli]MBN6417450.1 3'-5' exoribonuclease [Escherichia coli]
MRAFCQSLRACSEGNNPYPELKLHAIGWVWGNGANFDNTILRRSYERQGIPCPWRYYNDRDVRTIVELGKAIDFDARTAIPFEGERHNALDDARYQAKYVSVIWQKLIPSQADS